MSKIMEFQGTNSPFPTESEFLKLKELKIFSKTFQNIIELMDNMTYF